MYVEKKVSKEEMPWVVYEDRDICKKCYSMRHKDGYWAIVMPHVMDEGGVVKNMDYPTVDTQFLFKWSERILDNYKMTQDRGTYAPLPELLKQMFEEAWVIVEGK